MTQQRRLELLWEGKERHCFCSWRVWLSGCAVECWGHGPGAPGHSRLLLFAVARGSSCIPDVLLSRSVRVRPWPWTIIWKKCLCFPAWSLNIFYSINLADTLSNFWSGNEAGTVEFVTWKHLFPALLRLCTASGAEGAAGCPQVYKLLRPYKMVQTCQGRALASGSVYFCKRSDWLTGTISHGACEGVESIKLCSEKCVSALTASGALLWPSGSWRCWTLIHQLLESLRQEIGELVGSLGGDFFSADSRVGALQ